MTKIKLTGGLELDLTEEQKKELIAQLGAKESKIWEPEIDKEYLIIDQFGDVEKSYWKNDIIDNFRLSIGNVFQTEAQAEETLKIGWVAKLQARKRLDDYIAEKGFDIDVDWEDFKETKYYIAFDPHSKRCFGSSTYNIKKSDLPHFKNESDRDETMQEMEEEYKILLGVK